MKTVAIKYAEAGWAVVALIPKSKKPLSKETTFKNATSDIKTIESWWDECPDANIGINPSKSGLVVIDVDVKNGGLESLKLLEEKVGKLETRRVLTGSGGYHFYYKKPEGKIENSLGKYPGIDIICESNHVVAPPSIHPGGGIYEWDDESAPIQMLPDSLRNEILSKPVAKVNNFKRVQIGPPKHITKTTLEFMQFGAQPGTWNTRLYKAAKNFQDCGYSEEEFIEKAEKITGELDETDLATIASAFGKESKYPAPLIEMSKVETWVREWLSGMGIEISYNTGIIQGKDGTWLADKLVSKLVLDAKRWAEENPIQGPNGPKPRPAYDQKSIEHVLNLWHAEQEIITIERIREKIKYSGTSDEIIREWLKFVCENPSEEDFRVIKHFIWQVKQKLFNKPVVWHIMPVFYGKTGSGKSTVINKMLEPINELVVAPSSMKTIEDPREAGMFGKFYVVFYDEMSQADKTDVESLKNKISSETVSYRKLGTNSIITQRNTATFIGASNRMVSEIINDPTSARRFWEITTFDRINYNIGNLDMLKIWQCVDENGPCPLDKPILDSVLKKQEEELRQQSPIEQWLEERTIREAGETSATFLWEDFRDWANRFGYFEGTIQKFGRELKRHGIRFHRKNTGRFYCLGLKPIQ